MEFLEVVEGVLLRREIVWLGSCEKILSFVEFLSDLGDLEMVYENQVVRRILNFFFGLFRVGYVGFY
jgi:hypothetical protein